MTDTACLLGMDVEYILYFIAFGCIWYEKYGAIWAISQRYGPYRIHNLAIWPYHIFDDVNYGITLNLYIKSMKFAMGFSSCDKISIAFALMWYQPYRLYRTREWYGPLPPGPYHSLLRYRRYGWYHIRAHTIYTNIHVRCL